MVGVSIGAQAITLSDGQRIQLAEDVPRDLLQRVATNAPYVLLGDSGADLTQPQEMFATALTDALQSAEIDAESVAIALPGWWGPSAVDRVRQAFAERDVAYFCCNAAEAVVTLARQTAPELSGNVVVVDLGSESSSVVLVRDAERHPTAQANPMHILGEGGARLDVAVLHHLLQGLQELGDQVPVSDARAVESARHALMQCQTLREDLSTSLIETVLPDVPHAAHRLRVLRSEVEALAQPWLTDVIATIRMAMEQDADETSAVVLTGGLAHMPLVSQRISAELGGTLIVTAASQTVAAEGAQVMRDGQRAQSGASMLSQITRHLSRVRLPRRKPAPPTTSTGPLPVSHAVDDLLTSIFAADDHDPIASSDDLEPVEPTDDRAATASADAEKHLQK